MGQFFGIIVAAQHKGQRPCKDAVLGHGAGQYKNTCDAAEQGGVFQPGGLAPCYLTEQHRQKKAQNQDGHCGIHDFPWDNKNTYQV